jgi:hypothetical protein
VTTATTNAPATILAVDLGKSKGVACVVSTGLLNFGPVVAGGLARRSESASDRMRFDVG